jgi:hypothetical protein
MGNCNASMSPQAGRLLRLFVAKEASVMDYPVDVLAQVAVDDETTPPMRVEPEKGPKGWKFRAAALIYTKIRRRPNFSDVLSDLAESRAGKKLDLVRETK